MKVSLQNQSIGHSEYDEDGDEEDNDEHDDEDGKDEDDEDDGRLVMMGERYMGHGV